MIRKGDLVQITKAQKNVPKMKEFVGRVCTVSSVEYGSIKIKEDPDGFYWLPEWFEPVDSYECKLNISENDLLNCLKGE